MSEQRRYTVFNGDDEERVWEVETIADDSYRVWTPDGRTLEVDARSAGAHLLHLLCDGRSMDVGYVEREAGVQVQLAGERHEVEVLNERELRMRAVGRGAAAGESPELVSPMAGKVVKVDAEVGQPVEADERLVVVEAMKMENDLKAHRSGTVVGIAVEQGDAVEVGDVLVVIEDEPSEPEE